MNRPNSLKAISMHNGLVVMTGQAHAELDHGQPVWVCSTMPPFKPLYEAVSTQEEAIAWLKREAGAQSIFQGALLPD